MNKLAYIYNESYNDTVEKIAMNQWKNRFNLLSDASQKLLENKGVLNRDKMLSGLKKGNDILSKKLNIEHLNSLSKKNTNKFTDKTIEYVGGMDTGFTDEIRPALSDFFKTVRHENPGLAHMGLGSNKPKVKPSYILNPNASANERINVRNISKFSNNIPKDVKQNLDIKKLSKDSDWYKTIVNRHEIDEIRSSQKITQKSKGNSQRLLDSFTKNRDGSHISKEVIQREADNARVAPQKVRNLLGYARDAAQEYPSNNYLNNTHDMFKKEIRKTRKGY